MYLESDPENDQDLESIPSGAKSSNDGDAEKNSEEEAEGREEGLTTDQQIELAVARRMVVGLLQMDAILRAEYGSDSEDNRHEERGKDEGKTEQLNAMQ